MWRPCATVDQHLSQNTWLVGHDPIYMIVEQISHGGGRVNRPHVDLNVVLVGQADNGWCGDRDDLPQWKLRTRGFEQFWVGEAFAREHEPEGFEFAHGCAKRWSELSSALLDAPVAEGPNAHAVDRLVVAQCVNQGHDGLIGLGVDVHPRSRPTREDFVEPRYVRPVLNKKRVDLVCVEVSDIGVQAGSALQIGIMKREEHAIGAEMDIGLQIPKPKVDRVLERWHRVLGPVAGSATV